MVNDHTVGLVCARRASLKIERARRCLASKAAETEQRRSYSECRVANDDVCAWDQREKKRDRHVPSASGAGNRSQLVQRKNRVCPLSNILAT
ncbi:hypothetical protein E4K65_04880 [Bradyrhizobium niftali]|uniref:Uncharacterized protein n=1 Tax=Bradyrhizobium niftali TaxID=2560055 RepID=A0A4Y9M874_9BRAD|nr:hypothetical protein E4K65_04880 [Bradyrhizobium niftali]